MGHRWQRVPNTPPVMKTPYVAYPTFLKFYITPLSRFLQPLPPLLFLMSCFFDLMGDCATFDALFHLMILSIYKCRALTP